jgi:hypothetical protein
MNQFRDEYTQLEYLQIAIFLIGLPLAALIGALLGLVGKWKQGRVVTAAVYGMGGAAAASVILVGIFFGAASVPSDLNKVGLLHFFDGYYSRRYTLTAMCATVAISLLAGIVLRPHGSKQTGATITMRQLFLVQLFAFIALGCWTGMRFNAVERASTYERARLRLGKREWRLVGSSFLEPRLLERHFGNGVTDWRRENEMLREAAQEPWLKELRLFELDSAASLDIAAIAPAKGLQSLTLSYGPNTIPPQSHVDALGTIQSLRELNIQGGDFSTLDLSPIGSLKGLTRFSSSQSTFKLQALKKELRQLPLQDLTMMEVSSPNRLAFTLHFGSGQRGALTLIDPSPVGVEFLWVNPTQIARFCLHCPVMTNETAAQIAQLPACESLELECEVNEEQLAILANLDTCEEFLAYDVVVGEDQKKLLEAVTKLALKPKMERLWCGYQFLPCGPESILELHGGWRNQDLFQKLGEEKSQFEAEINHRRLQLLEKPIRIDHRNRRSGSYGS